MTTHSWDVFRKDGLFPFNRYTYRHLDEPYVAAGPVTLQRTEFAKLAKWISPVGESIMSELERIRSHVAHIGEYLTGGYFFAMLFAVKLLNTWTRPEHFAQTFHFDRCFDNQVITNHDVGTFVAELWNELSGKNVAGLSEAERGVLEALVNDDQEMMRAITISILDFYYYPEWEGFQQGTEFHVVAREKLAKDQTIILAFGESVKSGYAVTDASIRTNAKWIAHHNGTALIMHQLKATQPIRAGERILFHASATPICQLSPIKAEEEILAVENRFLSYKSSEDLSTCTIAQMDSMLQEASQWRDHLVVTLGNEIKLPAESLAIMEGFICEDIPHLPDILQDLGESNVLQTIDQQLFSLQQNLELREVNVFIQRLQSEVNRRASTH